MKVSTAVRSFVSTWPIIFVKAKYFAWNRFKSISSRSPVNERVQINTNRCMHIYQARVTYICTMYTYIHHIYIHMYHVYIHTYIHTYIHMYHVYIHTYIHMYHVYIQAYIHTYIYTYKTNEPYWSNRDFISCMYPVPVSSNCWSLPALSSKDISFGIITTCSTPYPG